VNDLRWSLFSLSAPERPADAEDCSGCFGLGAPPMTVQGAAVTLGRSRLLSFDSHRYQLSDTLTRQTDRHSVRLGFDWEHTVSAGIAWLFEPNALNDDLDKPALLTPILGTAGLEAPRVRYSNVAPAIGVAWTATRDARTVVRAGFGRYFDPLESANSTNLM